MEKKMSMLKAIEPLINLPNPHLKTRALYIENRLMAVGITTKDLAKVAVHYQCPHESELSFLLERLDYGEFDFTDALLFLYMLETGGYEFVRWIELESPVVSRLEAFQYMRYVADDDEDIYNTLIDELSKKEGPLRAGVYRDSNGIERTILNPSIEKEIKEFYEFYSNLSIVSYEE